jgi:hypothetical protein
LLVALALEAEASDFIGQLCFQVCGLGCNQGCPSSRYRHGTAAPDTMAYCPSYKWPKAERAQPRPSVTPCTWKSQVTTSVGCTGHTDQLWYLVGENSIPEGNTRRWNAKGALETAHPSTGSQTTHSLNHIPVND